MIRLSVLDDSEIEAIHQASLRILAETGVVLTEPKSRDLLNDAGAKINETRVLLPPEVVERCIAMAGKRTTIRGRGGTVKILGEGTLYFHNLGGAPQIYNAFSGTRRLAVVQDVRDCHPFAGCTGELPYHHAFLYPHRGTGRGDVIGDVPACAAVYSKATPGTGGAVCC